VVGNGGSSGTKNGEHGSTSPKGKGKGKGKGSDS
jgi:hypothetical protein